MLDVITMGSATKDIFLFTNSASLKPGINKHFLEMPFDKKIDVTKVMESTGGSATNSAATFAKFGKKTAIITKIGDDDNANFIKKDLKKRGISQDYVLESEGHSPFSIIVVPARGEMALLTYRGLEKEIKPSEPNFDFKSAWAYIGPMPSQDYETLLKMTSYCIENDIKVAMNPGSSELDIGLKKMEEIVRRVDIISMNDEEASRFVGFGNDIKNLIKLGNSVKSMAIITKGKNGSLIFDKKNIYSAEIFKTKQINYVGAGDAYFSGFINALVDKRGVEDAINLGSYNASKVVQQYGSKTGIVDNYPDKTVKIRRLTYDKKKY